MALGSTYNNNPGRDEPFTPTVYSPYRLNNGESKLDPTCITFSFWKNSLKIGICPRKNNSDEMSFDMDGGVFIYLNHTKARILSEELKLFIADPKGHSGCGVPSGKQGIITFHDGSEFGAKNPVVCIRKVDDNGNVDTSFAYEVKGDDYYFSIRNYKEGSDFTKEFESYNNLELLQILTLLEEYYRAQTQAIAATVATQQAYSLDRIQTRLNAVAEKLGLEIYNGGNRRGGYSSSSSFFNRSNGNGGSSTASTGSAFETASMDDIY